MCMCRAIGLLRVQVMFGYPDIGPQKQRVNIGLQGIGKKSDKQLEKKLTGRYYVTAFLLGWISLQYL
jgi:hypothetical protein